MKICGVIAEYNPFHCGHALQLMQTRKILGQDTRLVCLMSGNFVQRGDIAIMDKYRRAQAAVLCGADLVLELPLGAVLSSAEGFARGAVRIFNALGLIGYLSFGSECGSARALSYACDLMRIPIFEERFQQALGCGLSYAAARQQALATISPETSKLLTFPNNTLGLEYCRALLETGSLISPVSILRRGAAHDSQSTGHGPVSASYLRKLLYCGKYFACRPHMPQMSYSVLQQAIQEGAAPVSMHPLEQALILRLRRLTALELARFDSTHEGFHNRLAQAIQKGISWEDICLQAQTRRYPLARIRRALLRAFLDFPLNACQEPPQYLRVLAIGLQGRALLKQFTKSSPLLFITKPLHEKKLSEKAQKQVQHDILADEIFTIAQPNPQLHGGGSHFRKTPYVCDP